MNNSWLKFFSLLYLSVEITFHLSQLIIGRLVYLLIKPNSFLTTIVFIIVLLIACLFYFIIVKFIVNKIRLIIKPLDNFLIKIEEFSEEYQRKNKRY